MATASPCIGYNRLLARIFGRDTQELLIHKGLAAPVRRCRNCGADMAGEPPYKRLCSACRLIPIACDWCGAVVLRERTIVKNAARRDAKKQFCSKHCQGQWVGRTFGYIAHPENIGARHGG